MTDIVYRLRDRSQFLWTTEQQLSDNKLVKEAADEIERLRDVIKSLREECRSLENTINRMLND